MKPISWSLASGLRALSVLVRARLAETARTPVAFVLTFVFPALLLLCLGLVFADGHPFERRPVALVCGSADNDALAAKLRLYHASMTLHRMDEEQAQLALRQAHIEAFITCREHPLATLEVVHSSAGQLTAVALQTLLQTESRRPSVSLRLESNLHGAYVAGLFPATIAFTVLFAGLYGLGPPLLRYRRKNILAKFALTPLSLNTLILAQIISRIALTLGQSVVLFCVGFLWWRGLAPSVLSVVALATVVVVGSFAFCALGMLFASGVSSEDTLTDLIASSATPLVLLSGAFFPLSELPLWLGSIARVLPSTQLVQGCQLALAHEFSSLVQPLVGLLLWGTAALWLGVKFFKPIE